MGVADKRIYRDETYYFQDRPDLRKPDLPSINVDSEINTTIKENPYKSNVNIEKDEIILQPDLSALFKAIGKKHSQGGIDVTLKPNSFVFSDDKSLAFTEKDHELFEFKKGGSISPTKNTPAEVLKRNVNPKHYNKLVTNLQDLTKDELSKTSSVLMLEKYINSLGNVAYLQEEKKGFPQGIPEFSNGTAPVYDSDLKKELMEQKQYVKYGGSIRNPYMQLGGIGNGEPYWTLRAVDGRIGRNARDSDKYVYNEAMKQWYEKIYLDAQGNPVEGAAKTLKPVTVGPVNKQGKYSGVPRKDEAELVNTPFVDYKKMPRLNTLPVSTEGKEIWHQEEKTDKIPTVEDLDIIPQGVKRADWQFTPWQRISQAYNFGKYASAKRYMPYRSRFNPSYTEDYLVNPQQTIQNVQGAANQQVRSLNTLSPILRNAQAAAISGNVMDQIPQIESQYDNQNAQIKNQGNVYRNQIANNARQINMGNDQQYYQQVITGLQNFDNMKSYLADQAMNNVMRDVETNQTLAYNLLTQNNPAYNFDWRSGNFTRTKKSILDAQVNPQSDMLSGLFSQYLNDTNKFSGLDPRTQSALIRAAAVKGLPLLPSSYKKGGRVNPYK